MIDARRQKGAAALALVNFSLKPVGLTPCLSYFLEIKGGDSFP